MAAEGGAPAGRLRRLRRTPALRDAVAETRLDPARLVWPIFVRPGRGAPEPIAALPGIVRYAVDDAVAAVGSAVDRGIRSFLLFGLPRRKDADGSDAWSDGGAVARAVRAIKARHPATVVATDVCLCAYTTHGHCGVLRDGAVANDPTLDRLARVALAHARAGADLVAPSAMMDHQVARLRAALDGAGFEATGILAYAAKYASAFYGPFREAMESAPAAGDRRGYQLDVRNGREALREIAADLAEGADIVLVKPALPCLDVVARARDRFDAPIAAYQVSGEYALLRAAAAWGDERALVLESLAAVARAGADLLVTYHAPRVAEWLAEGP